MWTLLWRRKHVVSFSYTIERNTVCAEILDHILIMCLYAFFKNKQIWENTQCVNFHTFVSLWLCWTYSVPGIKDRVGLPSYRGCVWGKPRKKQTQIGDARKALFQVTETSVAPVESIPQRLIEAWLTLFNVISNVFWQRWHNLLARLLLDRPLLDTLTDASNDFQDKWSGMQMRTFCSLMPKC